MWQNDGSLLASGTYNGKTRIWSADGEMQHVFQYHNGPVFAIRWNKSSTLLLSASFDKTVAIWDAATETKKQQIKLHDGQCRCRSLPCLQATKLIFLR